MTRDNSPHGEPQKDDPPQRDPVRVPEATTTQTPSTDIGEGTQSPLSPPPEPEADSGESPTLRQSSRNRKPVERCKFDKAHGCSGIELHLKRSIGRTNLCHPLDIRISHSITHRKAFKECIKGHFLIHLNIDVFIATKCISCFQLNSPSSIDFRIV